MKKLVLSNRARNELGEIYLHTLETFGPVQATRYHEHIEQAFRLLCRFPELGRPKDNLRRGLRLYAIGRHQILYTVREAIEIEGLPHDSRDLDAYLRSGKRG